MLHWDLNLFDEHGHIFNAWNKSTVGRSYSCSQIGKHLFYLDANLNYILNSFGLLLLSTFFNATYQRYPEAAINAVYKAFHFNYHCRGLFIIQALNRLAYAYYGFDYEEFRNKEDIPTRSVIEDFHSILGSILVLPEKTKENEGEVWDNMPTILAEYEHCPMAYKSIFIEYDDYTNFKTDIFGILLATYKYPALAPFFHKSKVKINSQYGEYKALRSMNDVHEPYLYKTYLYKSEATTQPQNCTYQKEELEYMKIEKIFNYKEINLPYHPFSNWEKTYEYDLLNKTFTDENAKRDFLYRNSLKKFPQISSFHDSKNYNNVNSDLIKIFTYPEELLALWEITGKKLYTFLENFTYSEPGLFDLNYETIREYEDHLLPTLNKKIRKALNYILSLKTILNNKEAQKKFMQEHFKDCGGDEEAVEIFLFHIQTSSMYCFQHIAYFAKMREVRPPLKTENL